MRIKNEGYGFGGWSGQSHPPDRKLWDSVGVINPVELRKHKLGEALGKRRQLRVDLMSLESEEAKYVEPLHVPVELKLLIKSIRYRTLPSINGRIGGLTAAVNRASRT